MNRFLPITISQLYKLDQSIVERIILEKNLKTKQEIMNFFALNKDKILTLFQENQIQSIIDEEFLDTQTITFKQIPSMCVSQSPQATPNMIQAYSNFIKEYFPKQKELFEDESQMHLIWPKYVGSLLIPVEVQDAQTLKVNQELCIRFGDFELRTKEVNQTKKKFFFVWNILHSMGLTNYRAFLQRCDSNNCIQIRLDIFITDKICYLSDLSEKEEDKSIFNKDTLKDMSMQDQKKLVMQKYASECIKVMKIFLNIKDTIPAILTPVEKSLDLLGAIQYRLCQKTEQNGFLKHIPTKLVVKPGFLPYYSNQDEAQKERNQDQKEDEEKITQILNQAEKIGQETLQKEIYEEKYGEEPRQIEEESKISDNKDKGDRRKAVSEQSLKNLNQAGVNSMSSISSTSFSSKTENKKQKGPVKVGQLLNKNDDQELQRIQEEEEITESDIKSQGSQSNNEEDNEIQEDDEFNQNGEFLNDNNDDILVEEDEFMQSLNLREYDNSDLWGNQLLQPKDIPQSLDRINSQNSNLTENSNIGNLLGVNDQTITDFFNLHEPPAQFQTPLFDFQKQALTWMLYKENLISFEQAARPEVENKPRELNQFWCETILLDGSLMYYNEYSQSFTYRFQKNEASLQKGGILADEMGLGKTVMALSLVASNLPKIDHKKDMLMIGINDEKRKKVKKNNRHNQEVQDMLDLFEEKKKQGLIRAGTLIVLPLSVLTQWVNEVNHHFKKESIHFYEYYDARSRSSPILHLYDIVFTTYNILGMEYKNYFKNSAHYKTNLFNYYWHRIILDEAHIIKGKGNNCSKGAYNLQAESRWCLTGTPIHNCFDDLYSLIYFLKYDTFQDYYWWNKHINNCENKEEVFKLLQNILKPILLRRTKKSKYHDGSSIIKIPKKTQKIILIPFSKMEKNIYEQLQKRSQRALRKILIDRNQFSSNYLHIFSIMTKLRQMCDHTMLLLNKIPMVRVKQQIENLEKYVKEKQKDNVSYEAKAYNLFIKNLVENAMLDDVQQDNAPINNANRNNVQQNINRGRQQMLLQQNNQNPFKKEVIQNLSKQELGECPICTELQTEEVSLIQCGHTFHDKCIKDYYDNLIQQQGGPQPNCPICRTPYQLKDITTINFSDIKEESKKLEAKIKEHVQEQIQDKKEKLKILKVFSPENSSKLKVIVNEVKKVQAQQEKVIIYSQFLGFLSSLQRVLNDQDVSYTRLDGSMNKKDRATAIKSFSEVSQITVILISLKAGAFGLNLIAANHVFICDPWYNPAIEEQAIERCHRIGQTKRVHVINFIMDMSIEQRILECQKTKRNMIQNTLYIQKNNQTEQEKEEEIQAKMKEIRYIIGFDQEDIDDPNRMKVQGETDLDEEADIFENAEDFEEIEENNIKEIEV